MGTENAHRCGRFQLACPPANDYEGRLSTADADFLLRAVNCHEELVKALEPFGYDDPQGDCFSDDAPVEIRCEGYVLLTATAGDLRQAAAALAKAKEPTSDETRVQQQDLDEETL
jgi:hypothetical protein